MHYQHWVLLLMHTYAMTTCCSSCQYDRESELIVEMDPEAKETQDRINVNMNLLGYAIALDNQVHQYWNCSNLLNLSSPPNEFTQESHQSMHHAFPFNWLSMCCHWGFCLALDQQVIGIRAVKWGRVYCYGLLDEEDKVALFAVCEVIASRWERCIWCHATSVIINNIASTHMAPAAYVIYFVSFVSFVSFVGCLVNGLGDVEVAEDEDGGLATQCIVGTDTSPISDGDVMI